jgi:hypothetical protein
VQHRAITRPCITLFSNYWFQEGYKSTLGH